MKTIYVFFVIAIALALFAVSCTDRNLTAPDNDYAGLRGFPEDNQGEYQYESAMIRMFDEADDFTYRWLMPNGNPHPWFSYIKTTPEVDEAQTFYFYAGQHYKSGELEVWVEDDYLKAKIIMMNDWQLLEAKMNVKLTGYQGPPAFGRFPYKETFDPALEDDYTFSIPWNSDWDDEELNIALHGEVRMMIAPPPTARVQVIHNSADLAAEFVDVWLNDIKLIEDFEFRTATPFIDAPAGEEFTIAIQGPGSTGPEDPIWSQTYTLAADETYILIANGIVSPTGYNPVQPFDIYVFDMAREEASDPGNTDVLAFHGSTDAPVVSVWETGVGAGEIIPSLMYGDFAGYLELGTLDYVLEIRDETGTSTVAAYEAPLQTLGLHGAAITVVASGFLNPVDNSDGPAFGLWVALATGGPLVELPLVEDRAIPAVDFR